MIQAPALLKDLQRLLKVLEDDLRVRIGEDGALKRYGTGQKPVFDTKRV